MKTSETVSSVSCGAQSHSVSTDHKWPLVTSSTLNLLDVLESHCISKSAPTNLAVGEGCSSLCRNL